MAIVNVVLWLLVYLGVRRAFAGLYTQKADLL